MPYPAGRRPGGAVQAVNPGSWAWLQLDHAARSGHYDELRPERVLVHVVEGPAAQPVLRLASCLLPACRP